MKIIHTADIHLGNVSHSGKLSKETAIDITREIRATFLGLVEEAGKQGVRAILISGDLFDQDRPLSTDIGYVKGIVSKYPGIDFYYLRGNHDEKNEVGIFPNLHTFGDSWTTYDLGDGVSVSGIELTRGNAETRYGGPNLDPDKTNIVMLHGPLGGNLYDSINLTRLRNKNIDYLALGHIHKAQEGEIDGRGHYAYPGILTPRGYDEIGEHGYYLLDTDGGKLSHRFVPFGELTFERKEVKAVRTDSTFDIVNKVKALKAEGVDDKHIYRIEITGEKSLEEAGDISGEVERNVGTFGKAFSVKDSRNVYVDMGKYRGDMSLLGQFLQLVEGTDELSIDDKNEIIRLVMSALKGDKNGL